MSILSPLDRLADKFNIIQFNTRELLNKLSIWATTTNDYIEVMLKVESDPYFEKYTIPSLAYIKANNIKDWTNFKPSGVKYWGNSMLTPNFLNTNDKRYYVDIDPLKYPPTHYVLYDGPAFESKLNINLKAGINYGDTCTFIVKLAYTNTNNSTATHYVNFMDDNTSSTLISLGSTRLVPVVTKLGTPQNVTSPIVKVTFQYINNPTVGDTWEILDLYEIPRYE